MSSPENIKLMSPASQPTSIMLLPDDLLLSCLARVSRLDYPTLSLVSKSFGSLIASHELYKARSLLGNTESGLYVCMSLYSDQKPRWFTLCRKPDQTLTDDIRKERKMNKSCTYVLAKAHTSSIYNNFYSTSECFGGKFHLDMIERGIYRNMYSDSSCEIDNVLYSVYDGTLRWFDTKVHKWRKLKTKSIFDLLKFPLCFLEPPKFPHGTSVRVANYGGNMAVFWDESLPSGQTFLGRDHQKRIWCTKILLERLSNGEIWGEVEWCDIVLLVPTACEWVKVLAVTS